MTLAGYVIQQRVLRLDRPEEAPERWLDEIPEVYRRAVLGQGSAAAASLDEDPECLGLLVPYRSLQGLARDARKPMFFLRPADGAIGGHAQAVQSCYRGFRALATRIAACRRSRRYD